MTSAITVTLPWMDETPTILKAIDPLLGVKTTLKREAVKLELSWLGLSDFDSINRIADENCKNVASKVIISVRLDEARCRRMVDEVI